MVDRKAALGSLRARAESDAALRAELLADPDAVLQRELGIAASALSEVLSEDELQSVTGGAEGDLSRGGKTLYCSDCNYTSNFIDLMFFHRLFEHGKI